MANFLSDLWGGLTGQQSTPVNNIIGTQDAFNQGFGVLNSTVAPGLVAFNKAMAPGITDVGLGVTNQLDPNILANLRGAQSNILEQLNMGGNLSPELTADITRKLFESGAATGFGASDAGRGGVILQTGLEQEARQNQRIANALNAGSQGFQLSRQLYNPDLYSQLGLNQANALAGDVRNVQAARDDYDNLKEDIRKQNFSAMINTAGRIAGTVIGGIYGGGAGAQIGGQVGGSLYTGSRVGGMQQQQAQQSGGGGGFLSGIMGMFGGGGGGGGGAAAAGAASSNYGGGFGMMA